MIQLKPKKAFWLTTVNCEPNRGYNPKEMNLNTFETKTPHSFGTAFAALTVILKYFNKIMTFNTQYSKSYCGQSPD